ncbi:MAG: hypothetical protein KF745_07705 [Phycisphaeraceae bacterium]|nr:hypothetical protein [Phycisphaeraceae bacterium]
MPIDVATWQRLMGDGARRLRDLAEAHPHADPAGVARLRREFDADLVRCALELAEARRRAASKFGDRARKLVADRPGVEMASSRLAAGHKAARFAALSPRASLADLCCGIGGDAMSLADAGLDVLGVDIDPARAWMAGVNAPCRSVAADVTSAAWTTDFFHIDPARRTADGSRRLWRLEDLQPSLDAIIRLTESHRAGAVKLGPGVDASALPPGEVEFISEHGRLTQAVLWTGDLAIEHRRATLLPDGATLTGAPGIPPDVSLDHAVRYVHSIDPAPERADLLHRLCEQVGAPVLHPKVGLIAADSAISSPWLTPFEVLARMPWIERRLTAWFREHDAGIVEVKTRAGVVNPDVLQPRLSGSGAAPFTLFVLRIGRRIEAIVTRRVDAGPDAQPNHVARLPSSP